MPYLATNSQPPLFAYFGKDRIFRTKNKHHFLCKLCFHQYLKMKLMLSKSYKQENQQNIYFFRLNLATHNSVSNYQRHHNHQSYLNHQNHHIHKNAQNHRDCNIYNHHLNHHIYEKHQFHQNNKF